jgi:hypothetical protein
MVFEIHHSFKEDILVPYAGIKNNIKFFEARQNQRVITADGIKCKVVWWEVHNILDMEDLVRDLYMTDPWDFLQTWHKAKPDMVSLDFVHIRLKQLTPLDETEETKETKEETQSEPEPEFEEENRSEIQEPEPEEKTEQEPEQTYDPKELLF